MHAQRFFGRRKRRHDKRQRMLVKMEGMRNAKARRRAERIAAGWEPEPRMVRWFPLELGVRDKITGETAWIDLHSVRDAARRLTILLRYYQPGVRSPLPTGERPGATTQKDTNAN